MLRVLGVDPGLTRCGVGVVEVTPNRRARLVHVTVVRTPADMALEQRLVLIAAGIAEQIEEHRPDAVAVERVFAQANVRTVMGTAQASGLALHAAAVRGIPVGLHTPSEVKAAVTGYGNADKKQVQAMIARILGLAEAPKPADAADALALAVCHAWRLGAPDQVGVQSGSLTPAQRAWRDAQAGTGGRSTSSPLAQAAAAAAAAGRSGAGQRASSGTSAAARRLGA
ncbi:Holliday junction endonuclease RuvC [Curtobacterium sp. PhB130]|nr:Holliday junction endonuclease RuvC [Curtobacterium sp. ZW137]ROS73798.1 Holliday junction endonuclease RuvC [Curtobacterium sp. PhB130]TCK60253.1 Holliday junction endonuclease RuvC [Curtobacterium sp. PhB136]